MAVTDNASFQSTPLDQVEEEEEQSMEQPRAAPIAKQLMPRSRRGRPWKQAMSKELFRSNKRISSCTHSHSHSPQRVDGDSLVAEAPIQTQSLELTRCCIQVLTATVKLQLLELINQYQRQVTVKSDCFREVEMPGPRQSRSVSKGREKQEKKKREKRSRMLSQSKKGAESRMTEHASSARGSREPSKTPSKKSHWTLSPAPERVKRCVPETEEYLKAALTELF